MKDHERNLLFLVKKVFVSRNRKQLNAFVTGLIQQQNHGESRLVPTLSNRVYSP